MSIETALVYVLQHNGPIASLVGDRIYPNFAERDSVHPCIIYTKIDGTDVKSADGSTDLTYSHFQVTCWADTYGEAVVLRDAVKACLDDYVGTVSTIQIVDCVATSDFDSPSLEPESDASNEFGRILEFEVWYHD
jgi:hypothetical protein